jgi:hypothetical protein
MPNHGTSLDEDLSLDILDLGLDDEGAGVTLCQRCQRLDIQYSASCINHRRGYHLRGVEAEAKGCEFCSLLLASVKDIPKPTYFYNNVLGGRITTHPDLYVHM